MANKKVTNLGLSDEQLNKSHAFLNKLKEDHGDSTKIEIRVPRWVNDILDSDSKTYFPETEPPVSRSAVISTALYSFNTYLQLEHDQTIELLKIADNYAYNKYQADVDFNDEDDPNIIAHLDNYDFIYLTEINNLLNYKLEGSENVKLKFTPTIQSAWVLQSYKTLWDKGIADGDIPLSAFIARIAIWYASLPATKREQIIKAKVYSDIKKFMKEDKSRYYDFTMRSGNIITMRPYKIVTHSEGIHNYIIGVGDEAHYAPVSLRLDRIYGISPNYNLEVKPEFTSKEKDILDAMNKYGPEFAYKTFDKPITIIRLSEQAQYLYQRIYIHRPKPIAKTINEDASIDYTFDCAESLLYTYFKKFDGDYQILKSETLKDSLLEFYNNAINMLK